MRHSRLYFGTLPGSSPSSTLLQSSLAVPDPSSPSPTWIQEEPVKWSVACQLTEPEKLGCWLGSICMQISGWEEILHPVLWPGERSQSGPGPLSQSREGELFTLGINYFRCSKGTFLYPSWHTALLSGKFCSVAACSWAEKFLILHHHASCNVKLVVTYAY